MEIIEIKENNFETFKADLIRLNDNFLADLNIVKERTSEEKESILKNMIKPDSPTHLLIGLDSRNKVVGMTYFNMGTGYSCGGDYLWLNSIYIKPEDQQKGYGSSFLNYIEKLAKQKGVKLFVSSRDVDNEKSKKLFDKSGFEQTENVSINKML